MNDIKVFGKLMPVAQAENMLVWLDKEMDLANELSFVIKGIVFTNSVLSVMDNFATNRDTLGWNEMDGESFVEETWKDKGEFYSTMLMSMGMGLNRVMDTICHWTEDEWFKNVTGEYLESILTYEDYLEALIGHYLDISDVERYLEFKREQDEKIPF